MGADKDDWRDAWMAEGTAALLSCLVLNERTEPSAALWKPEDDAVNSQLNWRVACGVGGTSHTPPGYRRPRMPATGSSQ